MLGPSTKAPGSTHGLGLGVSWAETASQAAGRRGQEAAWSWTLTGGFSP